VRRRDPESATALDSWLARLGEAHRDRILPVDRTVAEEWGRMNVPDPLPVVDGLLAATAKVSGAGVELLDPFASAS
jgi:toxin FitB